MIKKVGKNGIDTFEIGIDTFEIGIDQMELTPCLCASLFCSVNKGLN